MARTAFGALTLERRLGFAQPESGEFRCVPVHGASLRSTSFTPHTPFAILAMQLSCLEVVAYRNQSLTQCSAQAMCRIVSSAALRSPVLSHFHDSLGDAEVKCLISRC